MSDLILGPIIITKYLGHTERKDSRIMAVHRRDSGKTWRRFADYDSELSPEANHQAAAEKLLKQWPYENTLRIVGRGHDADAYYWLCQSAPV